MDTGSGKRAGPAVDSASTAADSTSRLFIADRKSGIRFLVDTGAEVSVLPAAPEDRKRESPIQLTAANRSSIKTYGTRLVNVDLSLRRQFTHTFIVADVSNAIIGADFLIHFNLIVDLKGRRLVDGTTRLFTLSLPADTGSAAGPSRPAAPFVEILNNLQIRMEGIDARVAAMLRKYPDVLRPNFRPKDVKHSVRHVIRTTGPPVSTRPRRLSHDKLKAVKADFEKMVEQGSCKRANSPWSSALTVVPKSEGVWRSCGDYRALNAVTIPDKYPIPHIQDFNQSIGTSKVFSTIDLVRAYHQIPVAEEDVNKTAVTTPFGNFVFVSMPFGLRNAAQTFQRFMDEVTRGLDFVYVYIDDIIVFSKDDDEHLLHLETLFKRLHDYGIAINAGKSHFVRTQVDFLGFSVSPEGIAPLPEKVKVISDYPMPITVKQLLRFLGCINFYRPTLPNAADAQDPLYALIEGCRTPAGRFQNKELVWTEEARQAFAAVKHGLANAVTLAHPVPDAPIALFTDASDKGMGAGLNQLVDGKWQPLGFFSRKFSEVQKGSRYSAYTRELLAIKESIAYFRHQLEGREFAVYTDHKPLTSAFTRPQHDALPKTIRDLDFISQFTTDIRHVSGADNAVADAFSRIEALVFNDFRSVAEAQLSDQELQALVSSPTALNLVQVCLPDLQPARVTRSSAASRLQGQVGADGLSELKLWVDDSRGRQRPYIPGNLRKEIFESIHNNSHPGIKETLRQVSSRFVWPNIKKDIKAWAKTCARCQISKVTRHTQVPPAPFLVPDDRFSHIHLDIIHLPPSDGYRYCLTACDRLTRWPEAWPITDMSAETVAQTFFTNWIARFGVPAFMTTDQGLNFESQLLSTLNRLTGTSRQRTTTYNPQANGMIERFHRPLKAALMAANKQRWTEALPVALLGLRSSLKPDIGATPAELVYGSTLRLPGEFFSHSSDDDYDPSSYVSRLRERISEIIPQQTSAHCKAKLFVPKDLQSCSHVFVRVDRVRRPLEAPYDGPFAVVSRSTDTFVVKVITKRGPEEQRINIRRLKPAFIDTSSGRYPPASRVDEPTPSQTTTSPTPSPRRSPRLRVHFPDSGTPEGTPYRTCTPLTGP